MAASIWKFPPVGASHFRAPAILPTLREIEAKGHNETAKRLRQYCEAVFAFALSTGIAERNVGADLRGALAPGRVTNRPAIIDPKGVAQLLRATDGYQGSPVTLAALRLAPLVFVRPGELRQAEWSEIDLEAAAGPRWSIPAEKMKCAGSHCAALKAGCDHRGSSSLDRPWSLPYPRPGFRPGGCHRIHGDHRRFAPGPGL